jgi:hypothetical protein
MTNKVVGCYRAEGDGAYLQKWIEPATKSRLRPRTCASNRQTITQHVATAYGRITLQDLTPRQAQRVRFACLYRGSVE